MQGILKGEHEQMAAATDVDVNFAIESLFEEEPTSHDIPKGKECRIILTSRFKNDIGSLVADKRDKVRSLISDLNGSSMDEIRTKLNTRNAKKFKGISPATFKFRVNNAERIIFVYGNTIANNELIRKSDIIFLAYVEIHDEQEQLVAEGRRELANEQVVYSRVIEKVKGIVEACYRGKNEMVQPLFFAANDLPILSEKQQQFVCIQPPVIFRGSAGSGKTILSLEFYRLLHKTENRIAYITLTENMRKHAQDLLKRMGIENRYCFTFEEFVGLPSGKEIVKNPERLIEVAPKFKKRFPSLTEANVYTYVRGIIKGSLLNGNRKQLSGLISRDEFRTFAKSENLSQDEINIIYDAAVAYQKRLEGIKRVDDNDLSALLLSSPKSHDCIIVDEVQDLTELQIAALAKCCPSQKIFLFGDPNQVINPTVVDFGKIASVFYQESQNPIEQHVLKETWRSGPYLIEYINKLTRLRQKIIGKQNWQDDADEKSMRLGLDETYWASYIDDPAVIAKVLEFAHLSKDCIVIVNDEASLIELEKRMPNLEGRVFTVTGIKGLEYQNVIIYNVISDNESLFMDMLNGNGKRSTLHRMVFNKYYVACTRAQDRIFVCERAKYDKSIKTILLDEQGIAQNNDYNTLAYDKKRHSFSYFNFDTNDMTKPIPTSSTVWYYDDKIVVGDEARKNIYRYSNVEGHHFEKSIKMKLGQEHSLDLFGKAVQPYMVAAEILKHIKRIAIDEWKADKSGVDLKRAVFTVPINFSGHQRRALRKAAREAGIEVTTFIHEPFAAIIGYYFTNETSQSLTEINAQLASLDGQFLLTFDWGGGTLDITVVKVENGKMIELGTAEMTNKAGDKFDEDIATFAWNKFVEKLGGKFSQAFLEQKKKDSWGRILARAERVKILLSSNDSTNFLVDNVIEDHDIRETITRKDFEGLISNTIMEACNEIDRALRIAHIGDINIHRVLLTGGTCYIPAVQERIKEKFGHRVETVKNAELLIAQGAAVIAEMNWLPFLTKDISIELCDESLYPVFPKDFVIAADRDAKRSEDLVCADQRGGDAKIIIVEGDGQRKDKNLAILKVPVLNDTRFHDDIKFDAILDKDIVLHIKARSMMCHGYGQEKYGQKDENFSIQKSTEIHQLCFGLDFTGGEASGE